VCLSMWTHANVWKQVHAGMSSSIGRGAASPSLLPSLCLASPALCPFLDNTTPQPHHRQHKGGRRNACPIEPGPGQATHSQSHHPPITPLLASNEHITPSTRSCHCHPDHGQEGRRHVYEPACHQSSPSSSSSSPTCPSSLKAGASASVGHSPPPPPHHHPPDGPAAISLPLQLPPPQAAVAVEARRPRLPKEEQRPQQRQQRREGRLRYSKYLSARIDGACNGGRGRRWAALLA
jgi:hypothetical protein